MEKKRLTASEREALLRLNIALDVLTVEPGRLEARTAMIPYARRDIGLMKAKIHKLMEAYTDTIPDEQLLSWRNTLRGASYTVGMKKVGSQGRNEKDYGLWMSFETLNELLLAIHDKCLMCDLDRGQRRACRLKKALDSIPNDVPEKNDGDCQYFTI